MSEHTRGELRLSESGPKWIALNDGGGIVFQTMPDGMEDLRQAANARRLVAAWNAFDDLLEACRTAHSALSQYRVDLMGCESYIPNLGGLIVNLERVIARATGGTA